MKKISVILIPIIFTIAILIGTIFNLYLRPSSDPQCGSSMVALGKPNIGGQFHLTDANGQKFSSKHLITQPSLIYFGYSYCPDVCPYDLLRNVLAVDTLHEKGKEIQPIFITIDPTRDTPQRLREFSDFVHPKLIALTGSPDEIEEVMKLFKVYGKKSNQDPSDKSSYLMDHSAFTYFIDGSGKFLDYFSRTVTSEDMVERINCHLG